MIAEIDLYFQTLVQLAMQQQYILAQQQQLAAMPGVFLPNPYVITAPNAGGKFGKFAATTVMLSCAIL